MATSALPAKQIAEETIIEKIYLIRGVKVMLDKDLAEMYDVPTFRLNEAVKRNVSRFPDDFMFQLTDTEFKIFGIANCDIKKYRQRRHKKTSIRLHRTGRCNVIIGFTVRKSNPGKYSNHSRLYPHEANII